MSDTSTVQLPEPNALTGGHVLSLVVGFFTIIFAVNGYFLYSALSTYTGLVANEPYRKGLAYNSRIAADERQAGLGWQDDIRLSRTGDISVTLKDQAGQPVSNLLIVATIGRPATAGFDRKIDLAERQSGDYVATTVAIPDGQWIVSIEARTKADTPDPIFRARRRLWLKP